MDFFAPLVEKEKWNKNFLSVLLPFRKSERELFNQWAEGFVDRDGKLVIEFQTTFNSSFWEIYLFSCFKEYGFKVDWSHQSPDFILTEIGGGLIVEAATTNSAQGKPNEWDRNFSQEELEVLQCFRDINTEAIIRLSNTILTKVKKYHDTYKKLDHVKNKPFILAVAPFEQPHFNIQYDRPIRALLYDYYVDEDAFLENPEGHPDGPLSINLGFVEKDNGAEIPLGIFNDSQLSEISAVIFSCTATWGKLSAMSRNPATSTVVRSIWATAPDGVPEKRCCSPAEHEEGILDGLHIYHNPYATYPLSPNIFRAPRVVQHYFDHQTLQWIHEGQTDALLYRQVLVSENSEKSL